MPIRHSVHLICDECRNHVLTELEYCPPVSVLPPLAERDPSAIGWEIAHANLSAIDDDGFYNADIEQSSAPPTVTCSPECRKVIDARRRLHAR